jgi:homoserine O-acetyltransferase
MDGHDVGALGEAARATGSRVRHVVGVGVDTDILYPAAEVRGWVDQYRAHGANATYAEIQSICGHDAFLIELDQVARILGAAG